MPPDFHGAIEINVACGGITNVNVRQSFKADPEEDAEPVAATEKA